MFSLTLRGSQVTSRLALSSMMRPIIYIPLILLCSYSLLSSVLSLQCNKTTHYEWPTGNPTLCCNMCKPGEYMNWRSKTNCATDCRACPDDRYTDTHNHKMKCEPCRDCNKTNLNMEFVTPCSSTQNAVCRCKAGYSCIDDSCTSCALMTSQQPTSSTPEAVETSCNNTHNAPCRCKAGDCTPGAATNRPMLRPSTSDMAPQTTSTKPAKLIKDTVWFLVIILLLCVGIVMIFATKIRPVLHWIRSKHGYYLANYPIIQVPPCTEEDEVSKPVQEMCGKCEQPIDV